jgi:hypothetical protein
MDVGAPNTCIWQQYNALWYGSFISHFVLKVPHQKNKMQATTDLNPLMECSAIMQVNDNI